MEPGVISALEVQKRNKDRVNVYLDGEFAFGLSLFEAAKLHKGQRLTPTEIEALQRQDAVVQAVDRTAHFLAYRPRSIAEVRRNLVEKEVAPAVIDEAIVHMESLGYLDDTAFAQFWIQNRGAFKPLGPTALRHELREKGVADSIIGEVLAEVDTKSAAMTAAQERVRRLRGSTKREFRDKVGSFLQRRGFNYATARDVILQLIEDLDLHDPEYFKDTSTPSFTDNEEF